MSNHTPQSYMQQALQLAEKGRFSVSPNPMVGCVIVKNGEIIGRGYHHQAGTPHAEIHALQEAGAKAKGADAYVTLEPCCHHGRTPPCTDALIAAGVANVYFACYDPNPNVAGKGSAALKAAGIHAEEGLCRSEAQQLNKIFFHFIQTKRPFVFSKWAMSLDGKTITHPDDSPAISSAASRSHSHLLRRTVDAILIGANTAINDDPTLTVRLPDVSDTEQPIRIVLANRSLPARLKLFDPAVPGETWIATATPELLSELPAHVKILPIPQQADGHLDLQSLLIELGKQEITSILVEGGMQVHESFFKAKLVNEVQVYLAHVIIGGLNKKQFTQPLTHQFIEGDIHVSATFSGENHV